MGSLLRTAKKHKKSRRLGEPEVMAREEYGELEVDVKIEMIRSLIPLGLMHVHELLDDEVKELAGERYARKDELERGRRHGTNPGTVGLAGQRVPIRVPRVRSQEGVEIPLRSYEALNDGGEVNDLLLKRVLYGISCRNYEAAAEAIPGAIGLSSSTVSRGFVQASAAKLREMQERDLSGEDVVALFLDGKSFADAMMVIALGITLSGKKRFLGFVETNTENEKVLTPFLRSLLARGLDSSQGLLVIIDGGKSLKAAVKKAFRKRVLIQRCQWHKRENVVSYLSKGEQASLRKRLQSAYNRPEYKEALAALDQLHDELEERNQSAAGSLEEGIEETLTLHRLGVYGALGRSFKTTNCLESVNALVEERCAKVDHWKNSSQRQRWLATALVDIERECAILSWKLKRLPTPWFDDVGKNNIKPQEKGAEMGSLLRTAKKHKKSRRLGEPEVMAREEYGELEVDVKIEMIRSLIPLGLMHVHELLDDEVKELAGERYARKDELERGRRHGTNPGTVGLAGQRVPIRVPRVRSQEGVEIPLRSYEALNDGGEVNDLLLKRVLYGISCRNYEAAAEAIPGAIGLSSSTVSRGFVQASAAKLREMQERDLSGEDVVALFLDGKSFADAMMVIALGITLSGKKRFLGFVETNTENEKVLTPFLRSLLARGLDSSQGLLVIIDGGKSLKAAVKKAFRKRVLIQRCQWHKRENVVSYLSKGEQASLRKRLQSAYNRPEYKEALAALDQLHDELEERNQSAAASLEEGIEETLTLHRLGVYGVLGRSFKTTNCLESVNALVEERCAKVDHWKNSSQRQRWLATALVDIEPRLRRVIGYRHLPKLREALKRELKIETKTSTVSKKKAA